jgi:DNA-binding transcriptional MerR regulator
LGDLDINELCEQADVTPRTVHFYVQQGLLPPAGSPGPGARYSEGHVSRIRLIRLLQKQHLPLAEIAKRTRGLSDEQVDGLLAETTKQRRAESKGSALEYIRGVLAEPRAREARMSGLSIRDSFHMDSRKPSIAASSGAPEMLEAGLGATLHAAPSRSQWERYTLADGMELHVRRPLSRIEQKQLEKLIAAARTILGDEEGER